MATERVKMTKLEGEAVATANVPADQVEVWKEAGWRVEVKAKK
jgi:hypothetical protein